jgi:anti-sigma B factor antagonist
VPGQTAREYVVADTDDALGVKPQFGDPAPRLHLVKDLPFDAELNQVSATTLRVAFHGELDMGSASQAKLALASAGSIGCKEIELDLSGLRFCDAAGLRVFVDAQRDCAERGRLLVPIDPGPAVTRVLRLAGLERLLADWRT